MLRCIAADEGTTIPNDRLRELLVFLGVDSRLLSQWATLPPSERFEAIATRATEKRAWKRVSAESLSTVLNDACRAIHAGAALVPFASDLFSAVEEFAGSEPSHLATAIREAARLASGSQHPSRFRLRIGLGMIESSSRDPRIASLARIGITLNDLLSWSELDSSSRFSEVIRWVARSPLGLKDWSSSDFHFVMNDACLALNPSCETSPCADELYEVVVECSGTPAFRTALREAQRLAGYAAISSARFRLLLEVSDDGLPSSNVTIAKVRSEFPDASWLIALASLGVEERFVGLVRSLEERGLDRWTAGEFSFVMNTLCQAAAPASAISVHAGTLFNCVKAFAGKSTFLKAVREAAKFAGDAAFRELVFRFHIDLALSEIEISLDKDVSESLEGLGLSVPFLLEFAFRPPAQRFSELAEVVRLKRAVASFPTPHFHVAMNIARLSSRRDAAPSPCADSLFDVVKEFADRMANVAIVEASKLAADDVVDINALRLRIELSSPASDSRDPRVARIAFLPLSLPEIRRVAFLDPWVRFQSIARSLPASALERLTGDDFYFLMNTLCCAVNPSAEVALLASDAFEDLKRRGVNTESIEAQRERIEGTGSPSRTLGSGQGPSGLSDVYVVERSTPDSSASMFALSGSNKKIDAALGWSPFPDIVPPAVRRAVDGHEQSFIDASEESRAFATLASPATEALLSVPVSREPEESVQALTSRRVNSWFLPSEWNSFMTPLGIPLLFATSAVPDFFRAKTLASTRVVTAAGEFKNSSLSLDDATPQSMLVAMSAAVRLRELGLPPDECIVPFFVANGTSERHMVAAILEPCFPVAVVLTRILDLACEDDFSAIVRARWVTWKLARAIEERVEELSARPVGLPLDDVGLGLSKGKYFPKITGQFVGETVRDSFMQNIVVFRTLRRDRELADKVVFPICALNQVPKERVRGELLRRSNWVEHRGLLFEKVAGETLKVVMHRGAHIVRERVESGGGAGGGGGVTGVFGPETMAARVLNQVRHVLRLVHRAGVVHMDLVPSNVLCGATTDDAAWVKLIDWDASLLVGQPVPRLAAAILDGNGHAGTPHPDLLKRGAVAQPAFDWWMFALIVLGAPLEDATPRPAREAWIERHKGEIQAICDRETHSEAEWLAVSRSG